MTKKELAVGEIGEINGVIVECVNANADQYAGKLLCVKCRFDGGGKMSDFCELVACHPTERKDGLYVIFKEATE